MFMLVSFVVGVSGDGRRGGVVVCSSSRVSCGDRVRKEKVMYRKHFSTLTTYSKTTSVIRE